MCSKYCKDPLSSADDKWDSCSAKAKGAPPIPDILERDLKILISKNYGFLFSGLNDSGKRSLRAEDGWTRM